ncbi:MAG: 50S ribosomal protein L25 [Planctomycetota bacterium]|jgi:large subunit ribosomal protein L25
MKTVQIKGEPRQARGTRAARALRKAGRLPVVIYGHGEAPEAVALVQHDVEVALKHGARTLQVDVNGTVKPYLIKEVQYDHFATTPIHMDLARVDLNERVRVRIGIELRGVPKGIHDGGVLDQSMGQIEIECVVTEIPDTLHPVVTHLGLGESLYVKDLPLPPGVTPIADPNDRVATVRVLAAEVPTAVAVTEEVEGAAAEPERIGRIRKDEEAEEEK